MDRPLLDGNLGEKVFATTPGFGNDGIRRSAPRSLACEHPGYAGLCRPGIHVEVSAVSSVEEC